MRDDGRLLGEKRDHDAKAGWGLPKSFMAGYDGRKFGLHGRQWRGTQQNATAK